MMEILVENWLKALATITVAGAFGVLGSKIKKIQERVRKLSEHYEANSNGTRALLKDRISQRHRYHTEQGYIYSHDLETFCDMVKSYELLNGNGVVPQLVLGVRALPVRYLEHIAG